MSSMSKNSKATRQSKAQSEEKSYDNSKLDLSSEFDALVSMIDTTSTNSKDKTGKTKRKTSLLKTKKLTKPAPQDDKNQVPQAKKQVLKDEDDSEISLTVSDDIQKLQDLAEAVSGARSVEAVESVDNVASLEHITEANESASIDTKSLSLNDSAVAFDQTSIKAGSQDSFNAVTGAKVSENTSQAGNLFHEGDLSNAYSANSAENLSATDDLSIVADDSSIVADESSAVNKEPFGSQSSIHSNQSNALSLGESETVFSKVAKDQLEISADGKLHHNSGKAFELSEIFPDIKHLSSDEQTRLNKEFISGIEGPVRQLLNNRYLERLGGSEFGVISLDKIKELIAKTQGQLTESIIVRLHALFNDIPTRQQLVSKIKGSHAYLEELQYAGFFDIENPLTLLSYSESQIVSLGLLQQTIKLRRMVVQTYMKHEEHILNAIKSYKFDPTTNEYQELVFYYYLLASLSDDIHFFDIYHKLVDLQNLYMIFKIFVGSFINETDLDLVLHNGDLNKLSTYLTTAKVDTSEFGIQHFLYLRSNLKYCLEAEAPYYMSFFDKIGNIAYQDTKRTYFSEGLPFDFGFVSTLKSYLLGIVADFIGRDAIENFEMMDADTERRPMMYYDIFYRQNQEYIKRLPEFEVALQDIGGNLQNAIKNNEITPNMREWAFHIRHQVGIFKTLDRLGVDDFDIFHHNVLNYCTPLYIQLYYQQLAFYSKYKLNIKRKRDLVNYLTVRHLNLLNKGHYIEALASEYTQEAKAEFRSMLAKRRGLFAQSQDEQADMQAKKYGKHGKGKLSERGQEYDLEQATDVLGATTLGILREGSTSQQDAQVSVAEMAILSKLRLEPSETRILRQLIKDGFKRLYSEHVNGKMAMDLDKGQYIGDYGVVPIIPGVSAHTAFLIARAMHFGDFGLHNQQMARVGFFYADMTGHYLASMFVVNLYSVLFNSNLGMQGNLYCAYLLRAVFAGYLCAASDENLFGSQYLQAYKRTNFFVFDEEDKKDTSSQSNFTSFVQHATHSPKVYLGSPLAYRSPQVQRLINIFKNGVRIFLKPDYGETYYQSLATLSKEHYDLFKKLNPNFGLHDSFEGEPLSAYNQFHVILSNAIIFILDNYNEHFKSSDAYTPVLYSLISQLYALMSETQSPYGCLAMFKYLSTNKNVEMTRIDHCFERFFESSWLSKIIYVQLFSRRADSTHFDNQCDEFEDVFQLGNIFWQLAMCLPDLREQGYNLLDGSFNSVYGNFFPCRYPVMDEFVKASAALQNGNSLSYMSAINHQMGNHELADLYALIANGNFSFKSYKDVVRYCIKHDLHELRLAFAQQMILLRQPYAYYEMFLCCKDLPERQLEAHTYLYFAVLLNVSEAKRDFEDLQKSEQFKPLPFLVYYLYLQELANDDLSALLCLMILTIDNSVVPANFSDYAKMLEKFTGCFSNSQLKRVLSNYGLLNSISHNNAYYYSSFYSIFPDNEKEAMHSGAEAINGNFEYLLRLLTFMDINDSNYTGNISIESCDAQVRVILGKMFEKLSHGKSFLERMLQVSWSRSQAFPQFLKDQYKDLIDDTLIISSHMDPVVFEIINNWVVNSFDPYNSTLDTGWCIALRQDNHHNRELEAFCETLWISHEIYPSRNLILSAVLLSLRSVRYRPYPRLFRTLCRYLANSGEGNARRYIQLDFDYLGLAPYGEAFEELVAQRCRDQVCGLAKQYKGQSLSQLKEQAVKDQLARYLKLHKEGVTVSALQPLPKANGNANEDQGVSDIQQAQNLKQSQFGDLKFDDQSQKRFEQFKFELNEIQKHREGDDLALWGTNEDNLVADDASGSATLDPGQDADTPSLLSGNIQIGDPGTWIGMELWGRNELLNFAFFMQLHSRGSMLLDLLCVKNGWLLGRKANGPLRSYSYYLAKSLLKNETGAYQRYLYYVQSHYFKYRMHEQFEGEDSKSATARKFVNDVLQFKLDSPKFLQFIGEMRKEGIFDFDGLISDAENGFSQGRYKFVGEGNVNRNAGWRDLFFAEDSMMNLTSSMACAARDSLKYLAAKIDHLAEVATGAGLDQKTIDELRYGSNKLLPSGSASLEGEQVDTVGLVGLESNSKGFGESRLRMQYGAMQVAKELVNDQFIATFLGDDLQRLTDATLSKQWINYTFYQEPYLNTKQDLLQMLPYTNSILEQCIQDNVGKGLVDASLQNSLRGGMSLVYEPRLIQWRSSKLRIKQEESFDSQKIAPDMLLQRFETSYDNALYQIDRTRFNILRQAPVVPRTVSATIESQAIWATQLNKRADLLEQGKSVTEENGHIRMDQAWQNTLITEDGYDSMLEKRMQHACFTHSKITDDIFYVSEQNYYKELLNKVVGAAENNPQLLKRNGVLGVILERANSSAYPSQSNEQVQDDKDSKVAGKISQEAFSTDHSLDNATTNANTAAHANVTDLGTTNLFKLKSDSSEQEQAVQNLEQLIKMASQEEPNAEFMQDKGLNDEVINENRSTEATLLNHLQNFLSEKMGDLVPSLDGAIKADKSKLLRNELDNSNSFISSLFRNLWDFDINAEMQYTRPKMFHEEESPLHTIIYSMVQEYMSDENLPAQIRFACTLMSRLHSSYGYFFGASDVVDSAFAAVIIECYRRRYYRELRIFNAMQHVFSLACEYLSTTTEDDDTLDALANDISDIEELPDDMCRHFNVPKNLGIDTLLAFYIPKIIMKQLFVDPHFRALATATHEQVRNYPELLMDDSFINQALFDLLTDKELLKYSKAVDGDTTTVFMSEQHQALRELSKLERKKSKPEILSSCAPLPVVRAYSEVDLSLWTMVNEDNEAILNPSYMKQAVEYMRVLIPSFSDEEPTHSDVTELQYFTPFELENQEQAIEQDSSYTPTMSAKKPKSKGKHGARKSSTDKQSEVGDKFTPDMPYNLFRSESSPMNHELFGAEEDDDSYEMDSDFGDELFSMLPTLLSRMNLSYKQTNKLMSDLMLGKLDIMELVKPMNEGMMTVEIPEEYLERDDEDDDYDDADEQFLSDLDDDEHHSSLGGDHDLDERHDQKMHVIAENAHRQAIQSSASYSKQGRGQNQGKGSAQAQSKNGQYGQKGQKAQGHGPSQKTSGPQQPQHKAQSGKPNQGAKGKGKKRR